MHKIQDIHVVGFEPLVSPQKLKSELAVTEEITDFIAESRAQLVEILLLRDPRFLVIVGPCSIHDIDGATEYAQKLNTLKNELSSRMFIVMRVYFEKPRTSIGWKGLISDPHLDGSCDMEAGLRKARKFLLTLAAMRLPAATEFVDPITPQYVADLITWTAIGARTTESQTHREMASGLSMPVGFKNGTDGDLQIAVDALRAASQPHSFIGINEHGLTCIVRTSGNPNGHIVLRGGRNGPNYYPENIKDAETRLKNIGLIPALLVDCSHANCNKKYELQEQVWFNVLNQRISGTRSIIGAMLESYLKPGNQSFPKNPKDILYGVSITDPCIGWEKTEQLLKQGFNLLEKVK